MFLFVHELGKSCTRFPDRAEVENAVYLIFLHGTVLEPLPLSERGYARLLCFALIV
jgi:hypothetical protein